MVVVVGGGCAGTMVVKALTEEEFEVHLVEPRDKYWSPYGGVRGFLDDSFAEKLFIPYIGSLGPRTVFHCTFVSSLDAMAKTVTLADGTSLAYDVCVLATGSRYALPFKVGGPGVRPSDEVKAAFRELSGKFRALLPGRLVVVIGGGAVGVETAAEIKTHHQGLRVMLIARKLLESETESFQSRVRDILTDRVGVKCELGTRVASGAEGEEAITFCNDGVLKLEDGRVIDGVSCIVRCTGARPNSESFVSLPLNEDGCVIVDKSFRVQGAEGLFCCGDVCSMPSPKLGYIAARYHAPIVAKNVVAHLRQKILSTYSAPMLYVFGTSLGSKESVFQVGWFVIENFLKQKARDLYTQQTWEEVGLTLPSSE